MVTRRKTMKQRYHKGWKGARFPALVLPAALALIAALAGCPTEFDSKILSSSDSRGVDLGAPTPSLLPRRIDLNWYIAPGDRLPPSLTLLKEQETKPIQATIRNGYEGFDLLKWAVVGPPIVQIVNLNGEELGPNSYESKIRIVPQNIGQTTVEVRDYNSDGEPGGLVASIKITVVPKNLKLDPVYLVKGAPEKWVPLGHDIEGLAPANVSWSSNLQIAWRSATDENGAIGAWIRGLGTAGDGTITATVSASVLGAQYSVTAYLKIDGNLILKVPTDFPTVQKALDEIKKQQDPYKSDTVGIQVTADAPGTGSINSTFPPITITMTKDAADNYPTLTGKLSISGGGNVTLAANLKSSGNTDDPAVVITDGGTFTMAAGNLSGKVRVTNGTFTMRGGTIGDTTTHTTWVEVDVEGQFTKLSGAEGGSGIIYGDPSGSPRAVTVNDRLPVWPNSKATNRNDTVGNTMSMSALLDPGGTPVYWNGKDRYPHVFTSDIYGVPGGVVWDAP
jgi:hypothetical protein